MAVLGSGEVEAQAPGHGTQSAAEPPDEAIQAYEQARAHYKAGRYPAAIEQLERALSLDPDSPELLYNVARVYELMGDLGQAVVYYRRYRDMLPQADSEERARVDETIARLEGARQYVEAQEPPEPAPPPPPPEPPPAPPRAGPAVWTMLSLSGSALIGGAITGGLALGRERELNDWVLGEDGGPGERDALATQADRLALSSDVLLGVSAATALTALVLYLTRTVRRGTDASQPGATSVGVGPVLGGRDGRVGLQLEGAF